MTGPTTLEDFEAIELDAEETGIFLRHFGSGPAVLLLHGFPQTHLMWRAVAPLLARRFTVSAKTSRQRPEKFFRAIDKGAINTGT